MDNETLQRIAEALERIANVMENKQKREINEALKAKRDTRRELKAQVKK